MMLSLADFFHGLLSENRIDFLTYSISALESNLCKGFGCITEEESGVE